MRPVTLDDYIGQESILSSNSFLRTLIMQENFISMILWGPPGCGKVSYKAYIMMLSLVIVIFIHYAIPIFRAELLCCLTSQNIQSTSVFKNFTSCRQGHFSRSPYPFWYDPMCELMPLTWMYSFKLSPRLNFSHYLHIFNSQSLAFSAASFISPQTQSSTLLHSPHYPIFHSAYFSRCLP